METKATEKILFSPVGDSDPIRKFHDGACLHIIRHYRPQRVYLFMTEEMQKKEEKSEYYTRPIKNLDSSIYIKTIMTGISEAHLYDSFLKTLPREVYKLHKLYPEAEILLNLSSGTPQIKTVLAILSTQEQWCRGIQVTTPEHRSNKNPQREDQGDIEAMIETNLDNDEGSEDRCSEPELRVLHFYDDKNRIESLIQQYEYRAAYVLARNNKDIPESVIRLLKHADLRMRLQPDKAKNVLPRYDGKNLFPFKDTQELLVEYFLTIQLDQRTGQLSNVLIKMVPFLYEGLKEFVTRYTNLSMRDLSEQKIGNRYLMTRFYLEKHQPKLLDFLDEAFAQRDNFKDCALSPLLLMHICRYVKEYSLSEDMERIQDMIANINKIDDNILVMRNDLAHNIMNIGEEEFFRLTKISSANLVGALYGILCVIYPRGEIHKIRNIYQQINQWIEEALDTI